MFYSLMPVWACKIAIKPLKYMRGEVHLRVHMVASTLQTIAHLFLYSAPFTSETCSFMGDYKKPLTISISIKYKLSFTWYAALD